MFSGGLPQGSHVLKSYFSLPFIAVAVLDICLFNGHLSHHFLQIFQISRVDLVYILQEIWVGNQIQNINLVYISFLF